MLRAACADVSTLIRKEALSLLSRLLALRPAPGLQAFGLMVLASPDPQRFNSQMGTDLLERLAELAGAALSVLQKPQA